MDSSFGELIKNRREALGLTQERAAKEIRQQYGVRLSSAYLSMIERNERTNLTTNLDAAIREFFSLPRIKEQDSSLRSTGLSMPASGRPLEAQPVKQIPHLNPINIRDAVLANEDIMEWLGIPEHLQSDFAWRVPDDSMINANIMAGDIAVCRRTTDFEPGNIVVAVINGDTPVISCLVHEEGVWKLRPADSGCEDHVINVYTDKIVAVVTAVVKNTSDLPKPDSKMCRINQLAAGLSPKKLDRLIAIIEMLQDD